MSTKSLFLAVLFALPFSPVVVRAAIIYTSGSPDLAGQDLNAHTYVAAESFTLSSTRTIRAVRFYSSEFSPAWDGNLDYFFFGLGLYGVYPASSPLPNGQGHNPAYVKTTLIDGGTTSFWIAQYDFDLVTPLTLGPGTFWLGIHIKEGFDVTGGPSWLATTTPNAQVSAVAPGGDFNNWHLAGLQVAFALSDTSLIPEPTTWGLLVLGIVTLLGRLLLCRRNS